MNIFFPSNNEHGNSLPAKTTLSSEHERLPGYGRNYAPFVKEIALNSVISVIQTSII